MTQFFPYKVFFNQFGHKTKKMKFFCLILIAQLLATKISLKEALKVAYPKDTYEGQDQFHTVITDS